MFVIDEALTLVFWGVAAYISWVDVQEEKIPQFSLEILTGVIVVKLLRHADSLWWHVGTGLGVFLIVGAVVFIFFKQRHQLMMGGGDIKLIAILAGALGIEKLSFFLISSGLLGIGALYFAAHKRIAFAPWIFISFFLSELLHVVL